MNHRRLPFHFDRKNHFIVFACPDVTLTIYLDHDPFNALKRTLDKPPSQYMQNNYTEEAEVRSHFETYLVRDLHESMT